MSQRPIQPVAPDGLELLFFYRCPSCRKQVPLVSPLQPGMAQCDACGTPFPVIPVDENSVRYIKLMLANGAAAIDPDFV